MKQGTIIKLNITEGEVQVEHGYIYSHTDKIIAVAVDLKSRHAELSATGSDGFIPDVILEANENTSHTNENLKGELTVISFPELKGYDVWSAQICKYTLHLCFVKFEK